MSPKWWAVYFGIIIGACLGLFLIAPAMGWWLPFLGNASNAGGAIDRLFYFILGMTGFFFVLPS